MTTEAAGVPELETAIAEVYRGPLEEFVARRDALAKQLRVDRRREDADAAKRLRKPTRTAWALNSAFFADPVSIERVAAAIAAALAAQTGGGGDLRAALNEVQAAVRAVAETAVRAASAQDHRVESAALVPALLAVIGDASAFEALRIGRLVEIPEGGGLDFLIAVAPPASPPPTTAAASRELQTHDADAVATAREELQRAEASLAVARERSMAAERGVGDALAKLEAAEQQVRRAEEEARSRRTECERARQDANTAVALLDEAERIVAAARARIRALTNQSAQTPGPITRTRQ